MADAIERELNVAGAVGYAVRELEADSATEPAAEPVDYDWMLRWRDAAGAVTADQLQHLWGTVLADEVRAPGSFSLRALEVLRNMSQADAEKVEALSRLALDDRLVYRDAELQQTVGPPLDFFIEVQELGLLSGAEAGFVATLRSTSDEQFLVVLRCRERALIITAPEVSRQLSLPNFAITSVGQQILRLVKSEADVDYLRSVGRALLKQGLSVALGTWTPLSEVQFSYTVQELLLPDVPPVGHDPVA